MTQQAQTPSEVGTFGRWVEHFEQNKLVHEEADAAIDFSGRCQISDSVRPPLIESIRRFQLGESGDGEQLLAQGGPRGRPRIPAGGRTIRGRRAAARRATAATARLPRRQPDAHALVGCGVRAAAQADGSAHRVDGVDRRRGRRALLLRRPGESGPRRGRTGGRRPDRRRRAPARPVPGGSAAGRLRHSPASGRGRSRSRSGGSPRSAPPSWCRSTTGRCSTRSATDARGSSAMC